MEDVCRLRLTCCLSFADSRTNFVRSVNPLTPNDPYGGRTAPLTSKVAFHIYIYSTNIGTEYFEHGIYSPFFLSSKCSLFHNSNVFGSCIIHILYTGCAKIKKFGAKSLRHYQHLFSVMLSTYKFICNCTV